MVQNMLPHLLSRVAYRGTEHTLPILLGILHHVWALMNQTSPLIATNAMSRRLYSQLLNSNNSQAPSLPDYKMFSSTYCRAQLLYLLSYNNTSK